MKTTIPLLLIILRGIPATANHNTESKLLSGYTEAENDFRIHLTDYREVDKGNNTPNLIAPAFSIKGCGFHWGKTLGHPNV